MLKCLLDIGSSSCVHIIITWWNLKVTEAWSSMPSNSDLIGGVWDPGICVFCFLLNLPNCYWSFSSSSDGKESIFKQQTWFNSSARKIPRRKDRLPTPVFLGIAGVSDNRESSCNVADLGSVPGLERSPGGTDVYSLGWKSLGCIL